MQGNNDFLLAIQYRHSMIIKSFLTNNKPDVIEKANMVPVPFIFCPKETSYDANDEIFMLYREGLSVKVQKIVYAKSTKPLTPQFELKASSIYFFKREGDHFYIMDESMQVKVLKEE